MKFLDRNQIIHCDIKPENILLVNPSKSLIKLIDFGSACFNNKKIYSYLQSRFYRAPEVILGIGYNNSIDMWSFGCLLVELLTGFPIFAGDSEADQLNCIIEVLGPLPLAMLGASPRRGYFFDENNEAKNKINSYGKTRIPNTRPLKEVLRGLDEDAIEVIEGCLKLDPRDRYTPDLALRSDFFLGEVTETPIRTHKHRQISLEDITRNAPRLQKFIAHRSKNTIC